ncbi:Hydrolase of the alpha/beta superfamily in cluster with COG2110 [hydrothermal vent metagenome]|uniref:Hydrolase of the alpha/beta superfamily in cluster with COG2110 n=1 Tax=hydrothermal vent metagenome TaxID=652676 RepID=A0A3B0YE31_9ZZZZ
MMLQGSHRRWFALSLCLLLFAAGCSSLLFVPDRTLIRTPENLGLGYHNVVINTDDHVRLHGWLLEGQHPVKGTIVFLHGNAQNISYHISAVSWLPEKHYNVFLYDYRGYGLSEGKPTVKNSIDDFKIAVKTVLQILPEEQRKLIIFGQSLGGALAIAQTARFKNEFPIYALVVDSAFSGFRRIAREKLKIPALTRPFSTLLAKLITDKPDILKQIALVHPVPTLFIHGTGDTIISYKHSELLYHSARQPKQLWLTPGAKHIGSLAKNNMRQRLLDYMDNALTIAPPAKTQHGGKPAIRLSGSRFTGPP